MNSLILEQTLIKKQRISQLCDSSQKCGNNKKITLICINLSCDKNMLHCQFQECSVCSQHRLNGCEAIQLSFFTKQLKTRIQTKKTMIQRMVEIQNQMMMTLEKQRESIKKFTKEADFSQEQMQILSTIFNREQKDLYSRKKIVSSYAKKLKNQRQFIVDQQNFLMKHFQEEIKQKVKQIALLEKTVIQKLFDKKLKIQSKIILPNNHQALAFINLSFDFRPKGFELIFRASENQFSGKRFNEKVNKIKNTFILAKTQYGKIIAGYSPVERQTSAYKWCKLDPDSQSFLLSINLLKKMKIIKGQTAFAYSSDSGPIFGKGSSPDLFIADKCNQANESYVNVFESYDCSKVCKIGRDQEFYTQICGAIEGNSFKVTEYEVFKVLI